MQGSGVPKSSANQRGIETRKTPGKKHRQAVPGAFVSRPNWTESRKLKVPPLDVELLSLWVGDTSTKLSAITRKALQNGAADTGAFDNLVTLLHPMIARAHVQAHGIMNMVEVFESRAIIDFNAQTILPPDLRKKMVEKLQPPTQTTSAKELVSQSVSKLLSVASRKLGGGGNADTPQITKTLDDLTSERETLQATTESYLVMYYGESDSAHELLKNGGHLYTEQDVNNLAYWRSFVKDLALFFDETHKSVVEKNCLQHDPVTVSEDEESFPIRTTLPLTSQKKLQFLVFPKFRAKEDVERYEYKLADEAFQNGPDRLVEWSNRDKTQVAGTI